MNRDYYCVIMAGGVGSRFWPMSRESRPKQFLDVLGTGRTFLQQTYRRFAEMIPAENIMVVTSEKYVDIIRKQLPDIQSENILLEKYRRNTALCIAYASWKIKKRNPDAVMIVSPSDHYISDDFNFTQLALSAMEYASNHSDLITIGVKPSRPETGYGYIQCNMKKNIVSEGHIGYKVKTFTEKPDLELARTFISCGEFLWNSGIFIWPVRVICDEIKQWLPHIYDFFSSVSDIMDTPDEQAAVDRIYEQCEGISIDYAIMEKTDKAWVFQANFGWSDLGTWESLYSYWESKDGNDNMVKAGSDMLLDTKRSVVMSDNPQKLVVVKGLENYMVVDTDDVLLICPKDDRKFKEMLADMKTRDLEKYQ